MEARLDRIRGIRAPMRVGLLGGSFDPPHGGHLHIAREALKRFGLDRVVWLVSPGNPLKPNPPAPLAVRMDRALALVAGDPRILVSDIEARIGTRYTAQTLTQLRQRMPGVRFVWLMGADNLAQFHRWEDWRSIAAHVPLGVLARPGYRLNGRLSPAARVLRAARISARAARALPLCDAPAWCYVTIPLNPASSTALRSGAAVA
jgi:nicotinate-nucleotide adenylyltransferase